MMWGDRLIDETHHDLSSWEASTNNTAAAIDSIPREIILCDWHYARLESYSSLPTFVQKGFRVIPANWRDIEACSPFVDYSDRLAEPNMLAHLFTI